MAGDGAGPMVERAQDRVADVLGQVQLRADRADLVREHEFRIDAQVLVHLGPPARGAQRRIGVRERQVAALGVHQVDVELDRKIAPELDRLLVEGDAFRRQIVGADDRGVAGGVAAAEVAPIEHRDVGDAVVAREIVRRREAVTAAADDHDVVAPPELGPGWKVPLDRMLAMQAVLEQRPRHRRLLKPTAACARISAEGYRRTR